MQNSNTTSAELYALLLPVPDFYIHILLRFCPLVPDHL